MPRGSRGLGDFAVALSPSSSIGRAPQRVGTVPSCCLILSSWQEWSRHCRGCVLRVRPSRCRGIWWLAQIRAVKPGQAVLGSCLRLPCPVHSLSPLRPQHAQRFVSVDRPTWRGKTSPEPSFLDRRRTVCLRKEADICIVGQLELANSQHQSSKTKGAGPTLSPTPELRSQGALCCNHVSRLRGTLLIVDRGSFQLCHLGFTWQLVEFSHAPISNAFLRCC